MESRDIADAMYVSWAKDSAPECSVILCRADALSNAPARLGIGFVWAEHSGPIDADASVGPEESVDSEGWIGTDF